LQTGVATDPCSIAVATISWARSPDEEPILERSLRRLSDTNLPIVVADRGTSAGFTDRLRRLSNVEVVVASEPGLVRQVHSAVSAAARRDPAFILYVEPDKEEFFSSQLMNFIQRASEHTTGVVLASRSDRAFATFPAMQRHTEGVFNDLCARVTGVPGDYCYGPFLMHRSLVAHVLQIEAPLGWGWRPSTFVAAQRRGLSLAHVVDDYTCAVNQRNEDEAERRHRIRQLSQNLLGLVA
jgi:hypothetical protein